MVYRVVVLLCLAMSLGCDFGGRANAVDREVIFAVIYPDGKYLHVEDGENLLSVSQFSNVVHEVSLRENIESVAVYVRPFEWWNSVDDDFDKAIAPVSMLTNVQHVTLIIGCSQSQLDLSKFSSLNIEELGFAGYELFAPRCIGIDRLPIKKATLINTLSVSGLAVTNRLEFCDCIGISPCVSEIRRCFPRVGDIRRLVECQVADCSWVASNCITSIVYDAYGAYGPGPSVPPCRIVIDISNRQLKFETWPECGNASGRIDFELPIDHMVARELDTLLQDAGFAGWRERYAAPEVDPDAYIAWRVAMYSGNEIIKESSGFGDVPNGIVAFWRLWIWGLSKTEGMQSVDPHATYRQKWKDMCFRPYLRVDDDLVRSYLYKKTMMDAAMVAGCGRLAPQVGRRGLWLSLSGG